MCLKKPLNVNVKIFLTALPPVTQAPRPASQHPLDFHFTKNAMPKVNSGYVTAHKLIMPQWMFEDWKTIAFVYPFFMKKTKKLWKVLLNINWVILQKKSRLTDVIWNTVKIQSFFLLKLSYTLFTNHFHIKPKLPTSKLALITK